MAALTRAEASRLADDLARLLDQVDRDDLVVSAATRYRLEGAVTGLRVVLGGVAGEVLDGLLREDVDPAV